MKKWIRDLESHSFGKGTYSQSYQDELLDIIFSNLETKNNPPFCIEFGFNSLSLEVGTGANTAKLVLYNKWGSLMLDGEHENHAINLNKKLLASSNISGVLEGFNVPKEPEYISIDVDSIDLWLFEALLKSHRAMLFSVEYNCNYPHDAAITFPNDLTEQWEGDRGYGASLKALTMVAEEHGYSLLWVVPMLDAFFIRNDLIEDGSGKLCLPYWKWKGLTSIPNHPALKDKNRLGIFIDYKTYKSSHGDVEKSQKSAFPVCKRFLVDRPSARRLFSRSGLAFSLRVIRRRAALIVK